MNVLKNFGIYSLSKFLNSLLKFLLIPYYSYTLSVENFGKIGLLNIIFPILSAFIGFGFLTSYSLNHYKISKEKRIDFICSVLVFSFFLFSFFLVLINLSYEIIETQIEFKVNKFYYLSICIISYFIFLIDFITGIYKLENKALKSSIVMLINTILILLLNFYFIGVKKLELNGYILANLLGTFSIIIFLLITERKRVKYIFEFQLEKELMFYCLKLGGNIVIGIIFTHLLNSADRYILKKITSSFENVGIYTMGYKIGELYNSFILSTYLMAINPLLLKKISEGKEKYEKLTEQFMKIFLTGSLLYYLFYTFGIKLLFSIVIDQKYYTSILTSKIVTVSYIFYGISQFYSMTLIFNEKIKIVTLINIVAGVFNIILNYLLIPMFELNGAAIATLLAFILVLILNFITSKNYLKVKNICFEKSTLLIGLFIVILEKINLEKIHYEIALESILIVSMWIFLIKKRILNSLVEKIKLEIIKR